MSQIATYMSKKPTPRNYSNEQYVMAVASILEIDHEAIVAKYKHAPPDIMDAQNIVAFLLTQRENATLKEIRDLFNKANHSSISLGISQYTWRVEKDKYFRAKAMKVMDNIDILLNEKENEPSDN